MGDGGWGVGGVGALEDDQVQSPSLLVDGRQGGCGKALFSLGGMESCLKETFMFGRTARRLRNTRPFEHSFAEPAAVFHCACEMCFLLAFEIRCKKKKRKTKGVWGLCKQNRSLTTVW